ncbi:MAG TPA: serine hydrolase, partial [Candidatus Paceibacterota bacterium]|nr:serine hydrolase [Candidatus Paceibacterota bacterium]
MNIKLGHYDIALGHSHLKGALEGAFTVLSLFSLMLIGAYSKYAQQEYAAAQVAAVAQARQISVAPGPLEAHEAIVYDVKEGRVLFEKDADESWPLASLTKLMSTEAVLSEEPEDAQVTITGDDLKPDGDSGLEVGDIWTLKSLITFGLIVSSNDAMEAAASSAGTSTIIGKMNSIAQSLGLSHTSFSNPTGLDIDVDAQEAGA